MCGYAKVGPMYIASTIHIPSWYEHTPSGWRGGMVAIMMGKKMKPNLRFIF